MKAEIPYILDAKVLSGKAYSYEAWVKRNTCLINELITKASQMLFEDDKLKHVNVIELYVNNETYTVMSLDRKGISRSLKNVINSWNELENYEKAAKVQNLLNEIENKY